MPRSRSSGALSIWSNATKWAQPFAARTRVIAAVRVVLPWSTGAVVPTLTCGFERSNFSLPMISPQISSKVDVLAGRLGHDLGLDALRCLLVGRELHAVVGTPLRERPQLGRVADHLPQRHRAGARR